MSPRNAWTPAPPRVRAIVAQLVVQLGTEIRDERVRRGWTLRGLAERAGVSVAMTQGVEAGTGSSIEGYVRLAVALGLVPDFTILRERAAASRGIDPVHAAMGELEARQIRPHAPVHLDEPYQHYQFAGRADLIAVTRDGTAMLHVENRTRFPDIGGFAGSYNSKRAFLVRALGRHIVDPARVRSETHVVVALWSSEVLHALRIREESFRAIAPDPTDAFSDWWSGTPPRSGSTSSLVVLDPLARGRVRPWIGLDDARRAEPRYRGYAEALAALKAARVA